MMKQSIETHPLYPMSETVGFTDWHNLLLASAKPGLWFIKCVEVQPFLENPVKESKSYGPTQKYWEMTSDQSRMEDLIPGNYRKWPEKNVKMEDQISFTIRE